jgi:hypothetical protein
MACSHDTDGDGNCGRRGCPECGGGPRLLNRIPPRNPETSLELSEIDPAQVTIDQALDLSQVHAGDCARHDERCTGTLHSVSNNGVGMHSRCRTCRLVVHSTLTTVSYHYKRTKD